MVLVEQLALVFFAGLVTALATGLGALPFFFFDEISDRRTVLLWGFSSGIMLSASVFGLLDEGLAEGTVVEVTLGAAAGVILVVVARDVLLDAEIDPREYEQADFTKLVLILGVLTVHSFPEGIAVGVAFADLGLAGGLSILGFSVPLLAVFMTIAISIHNIPEGTAISIPLRTMGVTNWKLVWWAVFSSLPQPVGAVIAFAFVQTARGFLAVGFGFAAGAMIYLVLTEFVPEALSIGEQLPRGGKPELAAGVTLGVLLMIPLATI
ncbi:zinc/iron permease [Natrialba chahannaoensis JCM 10990]|uniref:Zinc/iron permease n=1 Tax=Natrialba chahannaoensis JCM 10990 TaxID=1227492 RepID=M0AC91_9EURY|nr:ZIP family metal transporter [Natrialba chahannaoensis]ELY96154.1 zinc/iron permease [Natrialba chahannaoensis JCM 10990]